MHKLTNQDAEGEGRITLKRTGGGPNRGDVSAKEQEANQLAQVLTPKVSSQT